MKRREFLRLALSAAAGIAFPAVFAGEALAGAAREDLDWTPPIYKRFLSFTEYENRPGTDVIVIHHTGFPGADKDSAADAIHKYHQEANGWAGIGYHYLIRKDGMIEQGRRPPTVGAHVWQHNQNSVGVCLAGNFDLGRPTAAQMDAVKELVAWLCVKYGLDPLKKGVIVGHRDLNDDTACPGDALYRRLDEIRAAAAGA